MLLTTVLHPNLGMEKSGVLSYVPVKFHGVCLFFLSRSGSRLSGSGGGMCTSGEESSVELSSCAQLDTDEQQSSEEWLVRSKAPQLKSRISHTDSSTRVGWSLCQTREHCLVIQSSSSSGYNLIEYYNCLQHVIWCLCAHNLKEYKVLTSDKHYDTLQDCCFQIQSYSSRSQSLYEHGIHFSDVEILYKLCFHNLWCVCCYNFPP